MLSGSAAIVTANGVGHRASFDRTALWLRFVGINVLVNVSPGAICVASSTTGSLEPTGLVGVETSFG